MSDTIRTRKQLRAIADENGFLRKANRKNPVAQIFEDGTILRTDVRLDLCSPMTVRETVKLLGM